MYARIVKLTFIELGNYQNQNIINFNPRAKFIVLGKKPLDVARSWHNHLVHNGYENITNFEKAFEIDNNKSSLSYKQIMKWENRVNIVRKIIPKKNPYMLKNNS